MLLVLVLMMHRSAALSFELAFPSQFFTSFMGVVFVLLMRYMNWRSIGGRAVAIAVAHRENYRGNNDAHPV